MSPRVVSAFTAALQLCFYLTALIVTSLAPPLAVADSPDGKKRANQSKNNNNNNDTGDDEIFIRIEESRPELPDAEPEADSSGAKEEEPTNESKVEDVKEKWGKDEDEEIVREKEKEEDVKKGEAEEEEEDVKKGEAEEEEEVKEDVEVEVEEEEQDCRGESSEVKETSICEPAEVSTPSRRSRSCSGVRVELEASELCEYTVKESDDGYLVVLLRSTKCRHTQLLGTHKANQTASCSTTKQEECVGTASSQECHGNAPETSDAPERVCVEDSPAVPPSGQLETDSSLSQPGFENPLPSDLGNSQTSPEGSLPEEPLAKDIFGEKANPEESCSADSSRKVCCSASQSPEKSCSRIPCPEEPCAENTFAKDASPASACPDDSLPDAPSLENSSPATAPCLGGNRGDAPCPENLLQEESSASPAQSTDRPDYGLEELSTANVRQKFAMFEQAAQEDELQADPAQIRRSNSLLNRAARFMYGEDDDYGIENSELGDYEEDEEDEDEDQEEAGEGEEGEDGDPDAVKTKKKKKITRPVSFAGMEDLKRQRNRRDEMRKRRNQELSQFRQMLCAGKNISTREMFESGSLDGQNDKNKRPEQINIEGRPATKNLRERFEKGELGGSLDDQKEVDEVFRNSETASKARNLFKQMESGEGQENDERATAKPRENRLSKEGCDDEEVADFYGRDPNLVKYTDNLEEPLDCRKTKSVLAMFRKMEMQEDDDAKGPRPLKRFTPPPEGEYDDSDDEEYSDEEYSDEEDEEDDDEDEEEESDDDDERPRKPKYKDEILEMSARKAASLRAKFERWESEVEHNNEYNRNERNEDDEECMPSIDTARNLRAMFENKAQEASRPVVSSQPKLKVNRFVGGGGDKCLSCDRTVYAMERLEVAGRVLHKNCFKCCKCSTKLSMNSFSIGGEDIYCMTHYKQAFTEKGTYDVFTPNKGKWTRKIEATSSELAKSQE